MRTADLEEKPRRVGSMFNRIVPHYDLMNTLMTGGRDRAWRRLAVSMSQPAGADGLDVGTGTAELALELRRQGARSVVGVDFSWEMLRAARHKTSASDTTTAPLLLAGDALNLPFPDQSFDLVISGFVIRNVADIAQAFHEMRRVLRPGGRVVCLEITHPRPGLFARLFRLYFYRLVPLLGSLIARDFDAYRYLPNSLTSFPPADGLARLMEGAGLVDVQYQLLSGGSVAVHRGYRA
ncbi:MAG: class I SAM-dependent methyltransferase [Chloroflexota bacterium]|nr:MAG: class I SAM-dependent methyltransferase [Chloroflexota bacterium]